MSREILISLWIAIDCRCCDPEAQGFKQWKVLQSANRICGWSASFFFFLHRFGMKVLGIQAGNNWSCFQTDVLGRSKNPTQTKNLQLLTPRSLEDYRYPVPAEDPLELSASQPSKLGERVLPKLQSIIRVYTKLKRKHLSTRRFRSTSTHSNPLALLVANIRSNSMFYPVEKGDQTQPSIWGMTCAMAISLSSGCDYFQFSRCKVGLEMV